MYIAPKKEVLLFVQGIVVIVPPKGPSIVKFILSPLPFTTPQFLELTKTWPCHRLSCQLTKAKFRQACQSQKGVNLNSKLDVMEGLAEAVAQT
jgi:hypothetical protein